MSNRVAETRSTDAEETRSVVVEREIPHPPEKIWRALTQPHLIEEWLMKSDFKPEVGHRFNLRGDWGGVLDCEVLAIEPNRMLSYTWNHVHDDKTFNLRSVVTFTLAPTSAGTRLRVEQAGFRTYQQQAFKGAAFGWRKFLANLQQVLERTS
ncbi:SRPBCC family protein [Mesorhizobium sp. B1-1-8]|uniref:SRPBCC family protein n=1 Tax=Mesorhizobium sp. B1-1-8 TaxID=2589976 RepID=UPI001128849D|nr:SRPBCC domain-containing protein [Mesorhizobium sp. B1-1-8]UCI09032.1 SRPBCC domain-containing protein [Mesorhizobium sp. B1-1-8]